ncbi:MAG: hypothetical protein M0029_09540 [Actinomycetota bacterium]|nr:hypothetical protein [Actinomycetota bacterium]
MPSSVPAPSPSLPHGPLAHFLAHPDAWWKDLGHHLAHFASQVLPIAVPVVIAVLGVVAAWVVVRVLGRLRPPSGGQLVEVAMPAVVEAKGALAFWRNIHPVLAGKRHLLRPAGHVVFEVEGSGDGIGLRLWASAGISAHAVARAVSSAWPGAQCQVRDAHRPNLAGPLTSCGELRLAAPAWLPLGTDHVVDPLRTVIGALGSWDGDEQGLVQVQVLVRPAAARSTRMLVRAARSLQTGRPTALVPRMLAAWRSAPARPVIPDPMRAADVRHAVHKASDLPAFEVAIRYGLSCAQSGRGARRHLRARAHELTAAFGVYAGRNHLAAAHPSGARRRLERRVFGRGQVLGLSEVAALGHLPYDEMIPGLAHATAAAVAPPPGVLAGP